MGTLNDNDGLTTKGDRDDDDDDDDDRLDSDVNDDAERSRGD